MRRLAVALVGLGWCALASACPGPDPVFPPDYALTYMEVRNCRQSGDHDLHNIRVLADPDALAPYQTRTEPFPLGSIVLKEEYDFGDIDCSGAIVAYTVMQKLVVGSDPANLDWHWQRLNAGFDVTEDDEPRCAGCHDRCGVPPDGYDGTCTVP